VSLDKVISDSISFYVSALLSHGRSCYRYKRSTDNIEPTDINFGDVRNISKLGDSDPQACKGKIRHGVPGS